MYYNEEDYYDDSYHYNEEEHNWEEETYYALGGSNYERWRENGGNIDDMMDSLGY
jgi:hypothetical protein